ncbi:hypothetical protein M0R45_014627 [Rubus argutus]|uniref:Ig-like domain-containing protein n=1 Tax=Rubus argutus TaxID=59490 RepID=A0AAW1XPP7_RUBAR
MLPVGSNLKPIYHTFVGSVGLPSHSAISFGQDKVSVYPECEGGIFAYWVSAVGLPNPTYEWLRTRQSHPKSKSEGVRGGVVEAKLERRGKGSNHALVGPLFYYLYKARILPH